MSQVLDQALSEFSPTDLTPRLCAALMAVLPGGAPIQPYRSLAEAATILHGTASPAVLQRADALSDTPEARNAVLIANAIDVGDKGISLASGLSTVSSFFFGSKAGLQVDGQQRADACTKALAIALLAHRLLDGPPARQAQVLANLSAGKAILTYYGAVEIALPFADGMGGVDAGEFLDKLLAEGLGGAASKLLPLGGNDGIAGARALLISLLPILKDVARNGTANVGPLAETVKNHVPSMLGALAKDSLNDIVATGADSLPVYRYLVARLIAECCLARAREAVEPGWSAAPPIAPPTPAPAAAPAAGAPATDANPFATPFTAPAAAPPADANPFATPFTAPAVAAVPPAPVQPTGPTTLEPGLPTDPPGGPDLASMEAEIARMRAQVDAAEAPRAAVPPAPPRAAPPPAPVRAAPPPPAKAPPPPPRKGPPPPPPRRGPPADQPKEPVEPISGTFVRREVTPEAWLVFGDDGRFAEQPLASGDFDTAKASGQPLGRYRTAEGALLVVFDDGRRIQGPVQVDDYSVTVDGTRYDRADFDLTGSVLTGTWRADAGEQLSFAADGRFADPSQRGGTYALGASTIELTWDDGATDRIPFLSDLQPSPEAPDVLWLGGRRMQRA